MTELGGKDGAERVGVMLGVEGDLTMDFGNAATVGGGIVDVVDLFNSLKGSVEETDDVLKYLKGCRMESVKEVCLSGLDVLSPIKNEATLLDDFIF